MSKAKKFLIFDLILVLALAAVWFGRNHLPKIGGGEVQEEAAGQTEADAETAADAEAARRTAELGEWNLVLVNNDNAIPEDYKVETEVIEDNYEVDSRIRESLEKMLQDCRDAGYSPQIISAFRSHETQEYLYNSTANKADTAVPGHSEHECGLAVDIIDSESAGWTDPLIAEQEELPAQKWLMENCQNYGFILRYPKDKEEITEIIYEPWHYRYVGEDHAKLIMEEGICLEEYIEKLSK